MKKTLVLLVIVGLIASSLVAPAAFAKKKKKKKAPPPEPVRIERVVEFEYVCPCTGLFQLGGLTGGDPNFGGGPIVVGAEDLFVTGVAEDASGQAVQVDVQGDTDGDGFNNAIGAFCGETTEPIPIPPVTQLNIFITGVGVCEGTTTPAVGAGGTVTFTFSNLP